LFAVYSLLKDKVANLFDFLQANVKADTCNPNQYQKTRSAEMPVPVPAPTPVKYKPVNEYNSTNLRCQYKRLPSSGSTEIPSFGKIVRPPAFNNSSFSVHRQLNR